jgi:hypothetical protein
MRREALTLVFVMFAATFQMAACEVKEDRTTVVNPPSQPVASSAPVVAPSPSPSAQADSPKDGSPPIQGQVDSRQQPQQRDFEQKRN